MRILGISAFYNDSAVALIEDGKIIAATQEERFTRKKHDSNFPKNAIDYCLDHAKISINDIDYVVFSEKPFLKFERLLETYLTFAPKGFLSFTKAMPVWIKEKLFQKDFLRKELIKFSDDFDWKNKLLFSEHHLSHAASAFYPSPFDEACIITMDGVGEWTTASIAIGKGNKVKIIQQQHFPDSLGLLYSAFTYYTGFRVNSGEYKVMGLAPYGRPKYKDIILNNLMDLKEDGSFKLNQKYFNYCTGLTMVNRKFEKLFGKKTRKAEDDLLQFHMDIAASIQSVTEEIMLKTAKHAAKKTNLSNLCLAGGVALNCVSNGRILREKIFDNIWIQPAAGDAGGALGAAFAAYYMHKNNKRNHSNKDQMQGSYLGSEFSLDETKKILLKIGAVFEELNDQDIIKRTATDLSKEKAIGWMQGRMEFGPRALGNRSIIADPRSPMMQKTLNLKVKYRESFRPFAPSVLCEDVSKWFDLDTDSPYMLIVSDINEDCKIKEKKDKNLFGIDKLYIQRSTIPAITHVDYSARIQTVHKETNPKYHALISEFKSITNCSVLVNTSFNVRGEPIVCSPKDAYNCFMGTELDILVIGNCYLEKTKQPKDLIKSYKEKFDLD